MWEPGRCEQVYPEGHVWKVFTERTTLNGLSFKDAEVFLSWMKAEGRGEEGTAKGERAKQRGDETCSAVC